MATSTLDAHELPWDSRAQGERARLELVVAWSLDEPERLGEAAVVDRPLRLGRGEPEPAAPHARFRAWRPGRERAGRPLESPRLSRDQLRLVPDGDRSLRVENVGRCRLAVNGAERAEAVVQPGDTLHLRNTLVLVVVRRGGAAPGRVDGDFPFGGPDRGGMVGESEAAWRLRAELAFAAGSPHHVLLQGASGVGKELAARSLHTLSGRGQRPLVTRNAATLPESLVDAELFGSARGYPHAGSPERPGLIGEAHGSTLFLDEVGELPPALQAHLLRVLDRGGEYQRLGDARVRHADLRLVAATNRPLSALKHDFAARFPLRIQLPGLDERVEDIPLLVQATLTRARDELAQGAAPSPVARFFGPDGRPRIHPDLVEALLHHRYELHTRELVRLLWLAMGSSPGEYLGLTDAVRAELSPARPGRGAEPPDRAAIEAALAAAGGRAALAAEALGLSSRFALYRLMKKLGISGGEGGAELASAAGTTPDVDEVGPG
ncbi:sigma 54-interacting transcriptional regulator [Myxococcota bacterium]|nr:sigma 54-interacting transcriptional regulator [Myxococcota bacterium]